MTAPDPRRLAEDLRQVIGAFVRRVRQGAGTASTARSETLGLLDRTGPRSTAELARARHVRHQSMRLVLTEMEADGLIQRRPDPADGRGRLIHLSAAGRTELLRSRALRNEWIAAALTERLSEAEQRTLADAVSILRRLDR